MKNDVLDVIFVPGGSGVDFNRLMETSKRLANRYYEWKTY